jgi:hypothetical protein
MHLRIYEKQLNFLSIMDTLKLNSDPCAFQLMLDTVSFLLGLGHIKQPPPRKLTYCVRFNDHMLVKINFIALWFLISCNMLGRTLVTVYQTR